ncbi:uncharacterized protein DS421_8g227040 [Arachis hypogaea]|nr:uncharacterized protein DS421_8g227040 [Arachis hypogaea]
MRERDRPPPRRLAGAGVRVQPDLLPSQFNFLRHGKNVLEVLPENPALVLLLDSEHESGGIGTDAADDGVIGLGPRELGAEEDVLNGLVGVEVEVDICGVVAGEEVSVIGVLYRRERIKVGEDFPVEMILLEMVVVEWDFEGLVDMESVLEGEPPFIEDLESRGFAEEPKDKEGGNNDEEEGRYGSGPRPWPKLHVFVDEN